MGDGTMAKAVTFENNWIDGHRATQWQPLAESILQVELEAMTQSRRRWRLAATILFIGGTIQWFVCLFLG